MIIKIKKVSFIKLSFISTLSVLLALISIVFVISFQKEKITYFPTGDFYQMREKYESDFEGCKSIKIIIDVDDGVTNNRMAELGQKIIQHYSDAEFDAIIIWLEPRSYPNDVNERVSISSGSSKCSNFDERRLYPIL